MTIGTSCRRGAGVICGIAAMTFAQLPAAQQPGEDVARFDAENRLAFPEGTDRWIAVGSSIGGEYSEEPFDPARPGTIGVVKMEPATYDYFLEHGEYADGSMFLLSFYRPQQKPEPELPGFVQGAVAQREIHVIDRRRFPEEGRAFYIYPGMSTAATAPMPLGSACFVCHTEHGDFDGTFAQFYPQIREHIVDLTN